MLGPVALAEVGLAHYEDAEAALLNLRPMRSATEQHASFTLPLSCLASMEFSWMYIYLSVENLMEG